MEPSEKEKGREEITHPASKQGRERIEDTTGKPSGDYEKHDDHVHVKDQR